MGRPRILASVFSGSGHLHPLIPILQGLQRAGCEVLVATARDQHHTLADAGLAAAECAPASDVMPAARAALAAAIAGMPPEARRAKSFPMLFAGGYSPAIAEPLLALAEEWKPKVMLGSLESLATPLVAALLRMPVVMSGFGVGLAADVLAATAATIAPLWGRYGLAAPADAGIYAGLYVDPCPPSLRPAESPRPSQSLLVRPAQFDGFGSAPPLPERRPLVYVTLGTNPQYAAPLRLRAAIDALDACRVGAVITGLDASELGPLPHGVVAHKFVPQSAILPSCDAVICHAGASSLFGALAHGLPSVLIPSGADQFANAFAANRRGVGVALDGGSPASAIEAALRRVLEDTEIRQAARAVGDEIRGMPTADEAARGVLAWLQRGEDGR